MKSPAKQTRSTDNVAETVCRMIVRPLVGILLRSGLPFSRFAEICRSIYVEVAADEFGLDGRRTNTSRIALLTGLSRTRVKHELDRLARGSADENLEFDQVRPASRILMAWHRDPVFCDDNGAPLLLAQDKSSPSFNDLYEKYSGKIVPMTTMLKELINVGAIERTDEGLLRVLTRSFLPCAVDPGALQRVGMAVRDLTETAAHNLFRDNRLRPRFERYATNQLIPADEIENFSDFLDDEAQAFLERADNWLLTREAGEGSDDTVRVGVGVYQIAPRKTPRPGKE